MAKKQRLNVKFVSILGGVVALGVLVFVARHTLPSYFPQLKWWIRGTPAQHADRAKALFESGNYSDASKEYMRAIQLKGAPDAPLMTAVGDCYSHMVVQDPENFRFMVSFWSQALTIDPNFLPALQRLLSLYESMAEVRGGVEATKQWDQVQQLASKIIAVEPSDQHARIALHRGLLMRWINGVDTDPSKVDDAINSLLQIGKENPFPSEAVHYALQGRVNRGVDRLKNNDRGGASQIFSEVMQTIDDTSAAHPNDGGWRYRAGNLLEMLGRFERPTRSGERNKYYDRWREEIAKAAELIKPGDPKYVDVKLSMARSLMLENDNAGAIKLYQDLMKEMPNDLVVRLSLADVLARDAATRKEAISLLENLPQPDPREVVGVRAEINRSQRTSAGLTLTEALMESLQDVRNDPAAQAAIIKHAEDVFAATTAAPGISETPQALTTRGRLELVKNNPLTAVQVLERAKLTLTLGAGDLRMRINSLLATAYLITNQTGQAKLLLNEIVEYSPGNQVARTMLVKLLLGEGNNAEARRHLDVLVAATPDSAEIVRLQIMALDPKRDADKITALYNKLPEKTREDLILKGQIADQQLGKRDEWVRLFEQVRAQFPEDLNATADLARYYTEIGDSEKGQAVVEQAIAKFPDRPELKMLQAEIAGQDMGVVRQEFVDRVTDPLRKELLQYQLAAQQGKTDEALAHLKTAAQIKPDDKNVLTLQFQNAVLSRDWDEAARCVEALGRQNVDQADGTLFRVRLAMAKGSLEEAADLAQQLTRKYGQFSQSWIALAQVRRAQGRLSDAASNFETAMKYQPRNLEALRGLIAVNYELNQPAAARGYIDTGRKLFPKYLAFQELELQHELRYGDPEKAIQPRKDMLKLAQDTKDPSEAQMWLALGETYQAVARSKGASAEAKPFQEQARDTFKKALEKWPDELRFAQLYADASLQLRNVADGEKALRDLAARDAWKDKPDPVLMLADFFGRAGKPADQEKVLRDYLVTTPSAVPAQIRLSTLLYSQKKLDEALKLLETNASDPAVRRQRIELQLSGDRLTDAEKEIQTALDATPNPGPVLMNRLAFVYMKSGRTTQALQVLEKVLAQTPAEPEALFYRSSIWVANKKNLDQAIRDLTSLRDLPGSEINTRVLLSEAYYHTNDQESSIRELEDAVRLFPADKDSRIRLLSSYMKVDPPRWNLAERALREARSQPQLANDADLTQIEASMLVKRRDYARATEVAAAALKQAPGNQALFRVYCEAMLLDRKLRPLLAATDEMAKSKKAAPWVYQFRGRAQNQLGDKQEALNEFQAGLDVASAAQDDVAVASIIETISSELSVSAAKMRTITLAEKGDNRWRMMMSSLLQAENDLPGAIEWAEKVVNDPKIDPAYLDTARQRTATLYLRMTPPDCGKAVALYRKMLEKNPNDLIALNNIASAMILPKSGYSAKEALEFSTKAYDQVSKDPVLNHDANIAPFIYDTQGYVLVLSGRMQDGIALLRQAIDIKAIPEACYHLGEATMLPPSPDFKVAQESLQQALNVLNANTKEEDKPLDAELKGKIEKALEKAKAAPAEATAKS